MHQFVIVDAAAAAAERRALGGCTEPFDLRENGDEHTIST
jgi:hypothetical protein